MAKYKVVVNKETCIADGVCWSLCPQVFEMDDQGKSRIVEAFRTEDSETRSEGVIGDDLIDCARAAADACPTASITIEEIKE